MKENNMRIEGLVSVIVPIYNVEAYLSRCVDSIINQTYKNLEIILVDDGSPDRCGEICDEYARKDSRIVVIHKENGGLSDARNTGIEKASGEYISFIDSDDWIEPEMIETLYNACLSNSVKMAYCGIYDVDENLNKKARKSSDFDDVLDSKDVLMRMLESKGASLSACNKICHFELFEDVRFPTGKIYEDVATTYKCVVKANSIASCKKALYNYFHRSNSITTTKFSDRIFDFTDHTNKLQEDLLTICPEIKDSILFFRAYSIGTVLSNLLMQDRKTRNLYNIQYKELLYELKSTKKTWKKIESTRKYRRTYCLMLLRLYGPLKRLKITCFKRK